jgi:hypothetical protein
MEALSLIQHHWRDFRADLLPRLHVVYNMTRLLLQAQNATKATTRDFNPSDNSCPSSYDKKQKKHVGRHIIANDDDKDDDDDASSSSSSLVDAKKNHCLPSMDVLEPVIIGLQSKTRTVGHEDAADPAAHDAHPDPSRTQSAAVTVQHQRWRLAMDECQRSARQIERWYLHQANASHAAALHKYETIYETIEREYFGGKAKDGTLYTM